MIFLQIFSTIMWAVLLPWLFIRVEEQFPPTKMSFKKLVGFESYSRSETGEKWFQHEIGLNLKPFFKTTFSTWIIGAWFGWSLPSWF